MKRRIFEWLSNWLMEHGKEWNEIDHSQYSKDFLFIHAFYIHHVNFCWEEAYVFLGYRIKLFAWAESEG